MLNFKEIGNVTIAAIETKEAERKRKEMLK